MNLLTLIINIPLITANNYLLLEPETSSMELMTLRFLVRSADLTIIHEVRPQKYVNYI